MTAERILYHASAHDWGSLREGDTVTLIPGSQNAQGVGVYFSSGEPDVRASDSVHARGLSALFKVRFAGAHSARRNWYVSKGARDRKKGRPQTWHSQGKGVLVTIIKASGSEVEGLGELVVV